MLLFLIFHVSSHATDQGMVGNWGVLLVMACCVGVVTSNVLWCNAVDGGGGGIVGCLVAIVPPWGPHRTAMGDSVESVVRHNILRVLGVA